jgi:putative transposase
MLETEHQARNDLVLAACANGQQLQRLTVVDEYARVFLAIDVASSIRSHCVIEAMDRLISVQGAPQYIRFHKGPQISASAVAHDALACTGF